jgi:LPPG:FO 2-phospho-L-lactate transferase
MKIVAFAGGVGGAKLADGLAGCLLPENLTIIVNTGDDFEHWGLNICPDIDTVSYTLAGLANSETGWGRSGESWEVFDNVAKVGGADWFRIGDKDLATHLERTRRLKSGQPLSQIVKDFCQAWKIAPTILPMSDDPVATVVDTVEQGELSFQEYFVHQRCQPTVKGFRFDGIEKANPTNGAIDAIKQADAVIFCPSNPWVSIDPILNITGIRSALKHKQVVAISPIIGGQTVKGPAAKMFSELGIEPSSFAVAKHYQDILTGFVLDLQDVAYSESIQKLNMSTLAVNTIMGSRIDRLTLAQDVLNFIKRD